MQNDHRDQGFRDPQFTVLVTNVTKPCTHCKKNKQKKTGWLLHLHFILAWSHIYTCAFSHGEICDCVIVLFVVFPPKHYIHLIYQWTHWCTHKHRGFFFPASWETWLPWLKYCHRIVYNLWNSCGWR